MFSLQTLRFSEGDPTFNLSRPTLRDARALTFIVLAVVLVLSLFALSFTPVPVSTLPTQSVMPSPVSGLVVHDSAPVSSVFTLESCSPFASLNACFAS